MVLLLRFKHCSSIKDFIKACQSSAYFNSVRLRPFPSAFPTEDDIHDVAISNIHSSRGQRLPLGCRPGLPQNAIIEVFISGQLRTFGAALLQMI